ncbi:(2Fe-2S)-binding protein [Azospirillum lipoferum]|uniref:Oxidoreductase (2Fe-2S ferredoxin like subunit) n=1 Tax=Azospirillum lipoferum (strain 4B) TaxID=862719 RepID=G7ZC47_AZOL4|nr:(2Fe-2S)-binding protein [Azospirillum lipoferum]CBS89107.1 putative oxidoreductase (2Fe-2S ferredoxin like subunit) [Azospirillum lipoferum 4B]
MSGTAFGVPPDPGGRLVRLAETGREPVRFLLDGVERMALSGDTVLTAILTNVPSLRQTEFGPEKRAGFCLMGACQDCWIWQEQGPRIRACSTPVAEGMRLLTRTREDWT